MVGKESRSGPVSAKIVAAESWPTPGMVCNSVKAFWKKEGRKSNALLATVDLRLARHPGGIDHFLWRSTCHDKSGAVFALDLLPIDNLSVLFS
jgi:hypothetical protein